MISKTDPRSGALAASLLATVLAALLAGMLTCLAVRSASADVSPERDEDLAQPAREAALDSLLSGSLSERLAAAKNASRTLGLGLPVRLDPPRSLDDLVDTLILVLCRETDDWIARTLLDSIRWDRNEAVNRLFREALRSWSINEQAMAMRHLSLRKDPEAVEALESLWERDLPAWVRPLLIEALAEQGSAARLADFMRLTRDDEFETRQAAIEALGQIGRVEAIPALVRVLRDGLPSDRNAALDALGQVDESEIALEEILRESRTGDSLTLGSAIRALGRFRDPEAGVRLIALLDSPPDPDWRATIAEALEKSEHPDATEALVRLLHQPDVRPGSWIATTTLRVLHNRDDPDAASGLRDLLQDPGDGTDAAAREEIATLIGYLSRERSVGDRTVILSSSCSFGGTISAADPRAWHVVPPPPFETVRCWDGPDRPNDPEAAPRVPAGRLVRVSDHFEAPRRTWVELEGEEAHGCWVPSDQLRQGPGRPEPISWPRRHLRHEFDLGIEELQSSRALRLAEAGLLSVFEPGDEVVGAALEVDLLNTDQVALLRSLLSRGRTALDAALHDILRYADPGASANAEDDSTDDPQDEDAVVDADDTSG